MWLTPAVWSLLWRTTGVTPTSSLSSCHMAFLSPTHGHAPLGTSHLLLPGFHPLPGSHPCLDATSPYGPFQTSLSKGTPPSALSPQTRFSFLHSSYHCMTSPVCNDKPGTEGALCLFTTVFPVPRRLPGPRRDIGQMFVNE